MYECVDVATLEVLYEFIFYSLHYTNILYSRNSSSPPILNDLFRLGEFVRANAQKK